MSPRPRSCRRLRQLQRHVAAASEGGESIAAPAPGHRLFRDETVYTPYEPGGTIDGHVEPGWEPVKAAFAKNFAL